MKPSNIGGQAVMEGIMMRHKDKYAVAVRRPDKEIEIKVEDYKCTFGKAGFLKWPIIRGVVSFVDGLVVGTKCLMYSAEIAGDEEDEKEAAKKDICMPVLIEVNVAGEESKFGLSAEEVLPFLEEISSYEHIRVMGLMTIAPFVANPEENREVFQKLKKLSVDIAAKNINNVNMSVLSMGMTNDYQVAVEEGATMVRVGTGIFGERDYSIKED